jgi:hypothetical protein
MIALKPQLEDDGEKKKPTAVEHEQKRKSILAGEQEEEEEDEDGLFEENDPRYPNYDVSYVRNSIFNKNKRKSVLGVNNEALEIHEEAKEEEEVAEEAKVEFVEPDPVWATKRNSLIAMGESETILALEKSLHVIEVCVCVRGLE